MSGGPDPREPVPVPSYEPDAVVNPTPHIPYSDTFEPGGPTPPPFAPGDQGDMND